MALTYFSSPSSPKLLFINGQPIEKNSLTQFLFFPILPIELRLLVYALSLPQRILTVHYDSSSNTFTSSTALPALLSTCVESREVALKHYSLSFGTTTSKANIYFNPYLDTLYLPRCSEMGYDEDFRIFKSLIVDEREVETNKAMGQGNISVTRLGQLRSVAIDYVDAKIKRPWEAYNKASFLRGFSRLDEIFLVLTNEEEEEDTKLSSHQSKVVTSWRNPLLPPEKILSIWWNFRQSIEREENVLRNVCEELGKDYESFCLPAIRVTELQTLISSY